MNRIRDTSDHHRIDFTIFNKKNVASSTHFQGDCRVIPERIPNESPRVIQANQSASEKSEIIPVQHPPPATSHNSRATLARYGINIKLYRDSSNLISSQLESIRVECRLEIGSLRRKSCLEYRVTIFLRFALRGITLDENN